MRILLGVVALAAVWLLAANNSAATECDPGALRRIDLGVVSAPDLVGGPVTLYSPAAGEIAGPLILRDVTFTNAGAIVISGEVTLAVWDSDLARDGYGLASLSPMRIAATTADPITAGLAVDISAPGVSGVWQASHDYIAQSDGIVIAEGHIWQTNGDGTSGTSMPDFAGNIGGSAMDNGLEWFDSGEIAGSAHVYADVWTP